MSLAMTLAIAHDEHKRITERSGPVIANDVMKLISAIYNYAGRFDVRLPRDRHPCSAVEWNHEHQREGAVKVTSAIARGDLPEVDSAWASLALHGLVNPSSSACVVAKLICRRRWHVGRISRPGQLFAP
jgi:hypothetical protein